MGTLILGGPVTSAFTHFALYGLAGIVEDRFGPVVTLQWSEAQEPVCSVTVPGTSTEEMARAVLEAATPEGARNWSSIQLEYSSKAKASPFAPRIKAIDTDRHREDWDRHQNARHRAIDSLLEEGDFDELRFIGALGEASYWHVANNSRQPDRGASRWEMKTRNRGEEFISQRYRPLCEELSTWTVPQILDGLTGKAVRDPLGKNKQDSRSSTGFTRPAPADNAKAFCALRGISAFPVARLVTRINATPCAWPPTVLHPRSMILPVPTRAVTPARLRSVIVSEQLACLHEALMARTEPSNSRVGKVGEDPLETSAAKKWLAARSMAAVVRFPVLRTGSSSAPERQVLDGEVILNV